MNGFNAAVRLRRDSRKFGTLSPSTLDTVVGGVDGQNAHTRVPLTLEGDKTLLKHESRWPRAGAGLTATLLD